ncbi:hypothetical protein B296_00024524 [Ensete ventricosum]|uniref:Retrotransposon gag domain-containing protein n=1 Tax=Ensete ventricosum TaxID=4639 RepID=A0A426XK30_ENSVE|nr:hypothetical protein B296_00024524 [Ensete ventricosum]
MVQTIVPYLPQLVHSTAHQSAPPAAPPQTKSPAAPNRGVPPEVEPPQPQVAEAHAASPTPTPARSQSRSYNSSISGSTKSRRKSSKSRGEVGKSSKGGSPFTPEIQAKPLPATFRLPALEPYDGSGDPTEHIVTFRAQMALYDTSDTLMCRAFSTTLRGSARAWYSHLKPASIPSFDLLAREFELNFLASAHPKPTMASLLGMAQGSDEPLSQFVGRFTLEVQGIPDLHPSLAIQAFLTGLRPSRFFWSLIERPPTTLPEMLQQAHQYMTAEMLIAGKWDETKRPRGEQSRGHPAPPPKKRKDSTKLKTLFGAATYGDMSVNNLISLTAGPPETRLPDLRARSGGEKHQSHDDVLVISTRMTNAYVKRVMIDTGSSTNILYFDAFQRLGLTDRDLVALTSTLTGFTGDSVSPLGVTTIPVTFGGEPKSKTLMVSFIVVKLLSTYNAIIGRPTLNRLRVVVSTYHRILKFPTRAGVDEVRSDPRESR